MRPLGLLPVDEEAQQFAVDRGDASRGAARRARPRVALPLSGSATSRTSGSIEQLPGLGRRLRDLGVQGGDQPRRAPAAGTGGAVVGGDPGAAEAVDEDAALAGVLGAGCGGARGPTGGPGRRPAGRPARRRPATAPRSSWASARAQQAVQGAEQCAGRGLQQPRRAGDVAAAEQLLDAAAEGPGLLLAPGDGEHVGGVRPARVLVRVEALAEALERLAVRGHVGELGRGCRDDRVEAGEQGAAHRRGRATGSGSVPARVTSPSDSAQARRSTSVTVSTQ